MFARLVHSKMQLGLLALSAVFSCALGGQARAQFGEAAGIAEAMVPEYLSRDITLFDRGLGLDETQRVILEALFNDYNDAFENGLNNMKKKFENMREQFVQQDEKRVMALVFQPFCEWGMERGKIGEQFVENTKVILTPEQLDRWPAFERQLLREKELSKGTMSGESIDLSNLVRDLHLDDNAMSGVRSTLDEYEMALGQALKARKSFRLRMQCEFIKAMSEQDAQKSMSLYGQQITLQLAVRDVNDRFVSVVAAALPADLGPKFTKDAMERAYPRVYRETAVERIFIAATELEHLSAETLKAIVDLQHAYLRELATMNGGLLAQLRNWEPIEQRQRASTFTAKWAGGDPEHKDDPTHDGFLAREDMGKRYVKSLQAILAPEQFGLLPGSFRYMGDENEQKKVRPAAGAAAPGADRGSRNTIRPGAGTATPSGRGAAGNSNTGSSETQDGGGG